MNATYQIKPVKFSELSKYWTTSLTMPKCGDSLNGGLTTKRAAGFPQLTPALITSEYNMECYTPITEIIEC